VGLLSLLAIAGVVFLAAGAADSAATPGPSAAQVASSAGSPAGELPALMAVLILAFGAIALTATLVMSRARAANRGDRGPAGRKR
jgi:preprotein translocase subunit SecG